MTNTHLLIIDPQYDFCDPAGSLYVKGADKDMERLSSLIMNNADRISQITVTMDMHKNYHIASPVFWQNTDGENPKPFTIITAKDVEAGLWKASNKEHATWATEYVNALEKNGRYQLCIWPYHCIIGTIGSNIYQKITDALSFFELTKRKKIDYIFKGSYSLTEHYSALLADVPLSSESGTHINKNLLASVHEADTVLVAGEALSHCVANTVMDIGNNLSGDLSKFVLLEDASSCVAGFEHLGESFIKKAKDMGMKTARTADFL